jgi:hypothetical protein
VSICARFAFDQASRHGASLDRRLLVLGEPGSARLDHGRIDDLTAHGEVAGLTQRGIESGEQPLDRARLGQLLAIEPDGLGVRDRIVQRQPQEAHEREPIADLVLGLVVRERVEDLQHQHLEHQDRVVRRPPALAPIRAGQCRLELVPKQLKVDHPRQPFERIARRRQRRITPIQVEQARMSHHRTSPLQCAAD